MRIYPTLLLSTLLTAFLPFSAFAQTTAPASPASPSLLGASYLAGALANDARDDLRNPDLPPVAAATQATVLLQFANKLDPTDLRTLHLLAQTAQAAGQTSVRRAALRQIIATDPGDFVAQVQYIDLLADESQRVEDRVALYQGMLPQADLNAQVRSEIALRLARLADARGDAALCRDYLAQAVKFNDMNIGALRDLARLTAAETDPESLAHYLQALTTLLTANPYQPDAWLTVARIAQSAGVHDRAADFLDTAADQFRLDGTPPAGDLLLDLAIQFALAGQPAKARTLSSNLANLPDAPLAALLVDELLAQQNLPSSGSPLASQPASRITEIRQRLAALAKEAPNPSDFADAAGADLTILPTPGPDTPAWIDAYAQHVKPDDPTLLRLKGWLLFRQNAFAQAQTLLEKSTDPLAQLCKARILLAEGHPTEAAAILQELWNANPTGLLALQIALTANNPEFKPAKLTLADSATAKKVRPLFARLTPALANLHRQPANAQLVAANFRKIAFGPGELTLLQVRMTNALDRAVPVGPDGMMKTSLGLAAAVTHGTTTTPLGLYALEDFQRVYRLEPHQMMETLIRVDQGRLADLFDHNPASTYVASVTLLVAPRILSPTEFTVGLGGQALIAGEFQHTGLTLAGPADFQRLDQQLTMLSGDPQLVRITAAAVLAGITKEDPNASQVARLTETLSTLASSKDSLVRATLLRALPATLPPVLEKSLAPLSADPNPLVRVLWARHLSQIALRGADEVSEPARTAALATLKELSTAEKDPLVSDYLASILPLAQAATTNPK